VHTWIGHCEWVGGKELSGSGLRLGDKFLLAYLLLQLFEIRCNY
jgi:hypothetical protein